MWGLFLVIFVFCKLPVAIGTDGEANKLPVEKYEKAIVLEVNEASSSPEQDEHYFTEQIIKVKVLTGEYKGKVVEARNSLSGTRGWDLIVKPGDKVVLYITEENGRLSEVYIADMVRTSYLNYLILGFVLSLIIVGGIKGIKSLVALGFTILAIYKVLLPFLLKGYSPIPVTVIVLVAVTLLTMFIVGGISRKSVAATLGTAGGVVVAGLIAMWVGDLAHLTGYATEESRMLLYVENLKVDMQGLLFAGIITGALGAIMDVAMSIASSIDEIKKANPGLNRLQLMGAGMNVGRDIMGTMANTLILAYTGGALPLLLLLMAYNTPAIRIFNTELIATEIVRALAGSIGLIVAVPLTAIIAGLLAEKEAQNYSSRIEDF
ncbi:MAG: YibE/F family protein [Thermosyntropha sp.]|nr:YibE/F family protein [Thermosyntropha sp.]